MTSATMEIMIAGTAVEFEVDRFSEFARGADGTCAFCKADPCNENAPEAGEPETLIARYYRANKWAETCPVCDGRPS